MSYNDCIANLINDNKLNKMKTRTTVYQIKKIIRPLLAKWKKCKTTYRPEPQPDFYQNDINDNLANELLEHRILDEIDRCPDGSGVTVYDHDGQTSFLAVQRGQHYVPVHFARTQAGTFFWTSTMGPDADISSHGDNNPITNHQQAELQVACDRWAQA